jgi:hypothetical protein
VGAGQLGAHAGLFAGQHVSTLILCLLTWSCGVQLAWMWDAKHRIYCADMVAAAGGLVVAGLLKLLSGLGQAVTSACTAAAAGMARTARSATPASRSALPPLPLISQLCPYSTVLFAVLMLPARKHTRRCADVRACHVGICWQAPAVPLSQLCWLLLIVFLRFCSLPVSRPSSSPALPAPCLAASTSWALLPLVR